MGEKESKVKSVPGEITKQPCMGHGKPHGAVLESISRLCQAKIEIPQRVTTIINKPLWKYGHGNTQVKFSSTPIPKDLPPLLRARAVALSGKSVGVNIGRKRWGYRTALETEGSSREGEEIKEWATQGRKIYLQENNKKKNIKMKWRHLFLMDSVTSKTLNNIWKCRERQKPENIYCSFAFRG